MYNPARICVPGEAHPHSRCIPGEDEWQWSKHPYREWAMSLTENAQPHWEWGCASHGTHIVTGNGEVPHRKCTSSLGMHILTGNIVYTWRFCQI